MPRLNIFRERCSNTETKQSAVDESESTGLFHLARTLSEESGASSHQRRQQRISRAKADTLIQQIEDGQPLRKQEKRIAVNVFAIPPPKEQDDENTDPSKDSSTKDASQIVPLTKEALARAALSPTYAFARPPASPTEASSVVSSLAATPSPVGYRASNGRVYWVTNLC